MAVQRILGIDPGLRTTGYGVIDAHAGGRCTLVEGGVLTPDPSLPLERRLLQLHDGLVDVIRATQPGLMVVEELWTAYEHPQTAVLMGHARGVLALVAGAHGVPVHNLAHALVKRALTGSGRARKAQVNGMVVQLLGLSAPPHPADVSDALALALTFALRDGRAGIAGATGALRGAARVLAER